jgi:hypothetical protein
MIGIIVQLFVSYLIIFWAERGNLSILGLKPNASRLKRLMFFSIIAGCCSAITFFLRMTLANERWTVNPILNWQLLANGIWYNIKSVLFEELIFRGVLFYLLIKKLGGIKAICLSATAFGIYHWFSYEVFNDPVKMIWIFIITFAAGWVYAMGYYKTASLYTPIAMHFGWNFTNAFVFSNGNTGPGIWVQKLPVPQVEVSYTVYYSISFLHIVLFIVIFSAIFLVMKNENLFANIINDES